MAFRVRSLNPESATELELVAGRMRETLVEVLGEERGRDMYTLDWLRARVRFHLDGDRGQVFVAEEADGSLSGHTIVRVELEEDAPVGLFSTTYVAPEHRRRGVATALLRRGERWMLEQGLQTAVTWTDEHNHKLRLLYQCEGYRVEERREGFIKLVRNLEP